MNPNNPLWRLDKRVANYYLAWAQTRFWLIPATMCLAALITSMLCLYLDNNSDAVRKFLPPISLDPDSARSLMGIVATSVISVGGVSFSITMVALSLTSGQYGPKVLRQFLSSVSSKISLGFFFSTAVYAVSVFIGIGETEVPRLSLLTAIAWAGFSLLEFMRFVHRTTSDLQADKIIERLGREMNAHLLKLVDRSRDDLQLRDGTANWRHLAAKTQSKGVASALSSGYVQTADYCGVVRALADADAFGILLVRPGDLVVQGQPLLRIWCEDEQQVSILEESLKQLLTLGAIRTAVDDPQFPISQIQQIAARALSPGVNDPGTAISCIDSLAQALAEVTNAEFPGSIWCDDESQERLLSPAFSFESLVDIAFSPLRRLITDNLGVAHSFLRALAKLKGMTSNEVRRLALENQAHLLMKNLETTVNSDYDMRELRQIYIKLGRSGSS